MVRFMSTLIKNLIICAQIESWTHLTDDQIFQKRIFNNHVEISHGEQKSIKKTRNEIICPFIYSVKWSFRDKILWPLHCF